MDRSIYCCRFIFPATLTMAVVLCILMASPAPVLIGVIITDLLVMLCADPFNAIKRILAPQTRHIITCCTIIDTVTCYAYYYIADLPIGIAIFLGCMTIMLLYIARKLNKAWLNDYLSLDCREVSCALVTSEKYKYINYWDEKGRRICRSLLHFHLKKEISDDEMEATIRPVFIAGMASGDDFSNELLEKNKKLKKKLEKAEADQKKLQEKMESEVKRKVAMQEENLQYEISQIKLRNTSLSNQLKDLSQKKSESEKALKAESDQRKKLQEDYDKLQEDYDKCKKELDFSNAMFEKQNSEMIGLKNEIIRLENELSQYASQCDQTLYIQSLESEIDLLKSQLDAAIEKIDILEDDSCCHLAPIHTLPVRSNEDHQKTISKGGRPAILTDQQLAELLFDRKAGMKLNDIAAKYNISKATVSRICKAEEERKAI